MSREKLIAALKLGEVACLNLIVMEPIADRATTWGNAEKFIREQREALTDASSDVGTK